MSDEFERMLTQRISEYLGEKIKRMNILNQNGANFVYLKNVDTARKLGIPDHYIKGNVVPFPATTVIVDGGEQEKPDPQEQTEDKGDKQPSRLKRWWALGGTLAAAIPAILWLFHVLNGEPEQPTKPNQPPPASTPAEPGSVGLRIE